MNTQLKEVVEPKFTESQNAALERSFMSFYKLDSAPKIKRKLIVEKAEFNKFVKSRTRARTQFESAATEIDLSFDSFVVPFPFIANKTEFIMPSGKTLIVHETLNEPNGYTERVTVDDNEFPSYFKAEQYVLEQFLKEK